MWLKKPDNLIRSLAAVELQLIRTNGLTVGKQVANSAEVFMSHQLGFLKFAMQA